MSENLLTYRKSYYLYISLFLILVSYFVYRSQAGIEGSNGGTPQGYILGMLSAVLVLWLALLGIRKRSFQTRWGSVKGWVSAHVYLGSSLIIIASFHSAFQLGWNIHSFAYLLLLLVIFSGFYGVFAYIRYPAKIAAMSDGRSGEENLALLNKLKEEIIVVCEKLDSELQMTVSSAIERTDIGGSTLDMLLARDNSTMYRNVFGSNEVTRVDIVPNRGQQPLIDFIAKRIPRGNRAREAELLLSLLSLLTRRQQLLADLRDSLQLKARTKIWLFVHTPISIALLVALIIHIVSVFFYW
ncbi:MAG: hypothetical protein DHS20C12_26130 [Pseudohongiella sp.]|nr:MAG: hypothetical protein DHS20C12_26130 [Pseudohongiella sp.]